MTTATPPKQLLILVIFLGHHGVSHGDAYSTAPTATFDILIRGARVIDGSGQPAFRGDIGIRDGRIAALGQLSGSAAKEFIDASGLILCPGFVDLHNHADRGILQFRNAENYVRQGATTLLCGNCGSSPSDIAGFMRQLRDGGTAVNIVMLIGHGSVRRAVLGDRNVAPTGQQLERMRQIVRQAMEAGAVGMSTGLRYRPGAWARTEEVLALAKEIAPYGGFYATHMRDEGTRILEAMEEALRIGREVSVPVHISHHKISSASVWGLTQSTLSRIDSSRARGMDVTLDQYPYGAGSSGISLMVPQASLSGGIDSFRKRIANEQSRREIIQAVQELMVRKLYESNQDPQEPGDTQVALARIQLSRSPRDKALEGKNLTEILQARQTPVTLAAGADLIVELVSQGAGAIYHTIDERAGGDVDRVMQHPETCIASDGSVFAFGDGHPHPRSYGTYPRLLAKYVRERKVLSWEQAIHKMTGLPARRLGWTNRGLVKAGYWADIVLLDPDKIRDEATFQVPHRYSSGVEHVIVRGEFVLKSGNMTGNRPGRPILSVPVAETSQAQLRRVLLDMLQRYDVRFGLYAELSTGKELIAINAHDPFPVGQLAGIVLSDKGTKPGSDAGQKGQRATLRQVTRRLAHSGKTSISIRSRARDKHQYYLIFNRQPVDNRQTIYLTVAYDNPEADDLKGISQLVQGPILSRLRK